MSLNKNYCVNPFDASSGSSSSILSAIMLELYSEVSSTLMFLRS